MTPKEAVEICVPVTIPLPRRELNGDDELRYPTSSSADGLGELRAG
jgi:hypothetical protein